MRRWYVYPADIFQPFECFMDGELVTIVAESNSWKTTFAMDIIKKNAELWRKGFYINLEFEIKQVRENRWLYNHWKTKMNLTDLKPLTPEEEQDKDRYIEEQLKAFDYYNNPKGMKLEDVVRVIEEQAMKWYELFVIDTFSRIEWNLSEHPRASQNKCMEVFQELAQRLWIALVLLHHTNRAWTFEGSQKIMDLSNVFIIMTKEDGDGAIPDYRKFILSKDKYITKTEIDVRYNNWVYYDYMKTW